MKTDLSVQVAPILLFKRNGVGCSAATEIRRGVSDLPFAALQVCIATGPFIVMSSDAVFFCAAHFAFK